MTRRRISNTTPRELSAKERSALSDVVLERDSDFRVKTGSVSNPLLYTPEPGVFVLSEQDGKMYYANQHGWYQQGADTSPIILYVEYDGVTQFNFKFKAPAGSTLSINDGDGTVTDVAGNDDTLVTHTTNYSEAGTYYFYVEGDYLDLTHIDIGAQSFISGDVSRWSELILLEYIHVGTTSVSGDVSGWSVLTSITFLNCNTNLTTGDISGWSAMTSMTVLRVYESLLKGDISGLTASIVFSGFTSFFTFDNQVVWPAGNFFVAYDCQWTSTMVDNCLISLANGGTTGATINIGGNNAARTSASNAALHTLEQAGNTVTVNENLGPELFVNPTMVDWNGGEPEGWGFNVQGTNSITEATNLRFQADTSNDSCAIYQQATEAGKYYRTQVNYTIETSGALTFQGHIDLPTGLGMKSMLFKALGSYPSIQRSPGVITDITIDLCSIKEVI